MQPLALLCLSRLVPDPLRIFQWKKGGSLRPSGVREVLCLSSYYSRGTQCLLPVGSEYPDVSRETPFDPGME